MSPIDEKTLQQIVQRWAPPLTLYARQWCSWPDDAVQEAFIELIQLPELPPAPVSWLFRAVRFNAQNLSRSARRREHHEQSAAAQRQQWFVLEEAGRSGIDANQLADALDRLNSLDREIVVARIWGQLTWAQISELVERPISSLHRRYVTALQQLYKQLATAIPLRDSDGRVSQKI